MTSSTTPQDRADELLLNLLRDRYGTTIWDRNLRRHAKEIAKELADAGLLSSGTQEEGDGSLRSEPSADGEASVYVQLSGREIGRTEANYNGSMNVDMDDYDEPVGVEILDARRVMVNGRQVHPPQDLEET